MNSPRSDLLSRKGNYVEAWTDPADGSTWLDVTQVVSAAAQAPRIAGEHDQIAYVDLQIGQSVTVNRDATSERAPKTARTVLIHPSTGSDENMPAGIPHGQAPKLAAVYDDPTETVVSVLGLARRMGLPVPDEDIRYGLELFGAPAGDFEKARAALNSVESAPPRPTAG